MWKVLEDILTRLALVFIRFWLPMITLMTLLFILPIVAAPIFMATGNPLLHTAADAIMLIYHLTCHQIPDRCLYVDGFQMAVCSRCFAIYLSFVAGCVLFAFMRTRLKIWPLRYFILFCVPMGIDGTAQLFHIPLPRALAEGWQLVWTVESTTGTRLLTGAIFGLAGAFYVLPYLQEIFSGDAAAELLEEQKKK